jgi:DNA-binding response OmpR family regulator
MTGANDRPGGRRRLLAVDDNRLILSLIRGYFAPKGWDVTTADKVATAREALAVGTFDVIVSDILMPEVDGWMFFEEVRKCPETSSIPFVFLTIENELPHRLRGLHLGADDYMTKPFAVEELEARIERLLKRSGTQLSGSVAHLTISDLLQILALNRKDGTVRLERMDDNGRIEFVDGRIVDAQAGSAYGTKALFRMLGWSDATFRVMPRESDAPEAAIAGATASVLMEGLVSHDEWVRWAESLPAREARLELTEDARTRLHGQTLRPVEFDLVERAKEGLTVAGALEESPFLDAEIAEAICTLLARGVVRSVRAANEAETPLGR